MILFGIPFNFSSVENIVQLTSGKAECEARKDFRALHFINAFTVTSANDDPRLLEILNNARSINIIDGKSLVLAKKLLGISQQILSIRGEDFIFRVFESSEKLGIRHAFVGSTSDVLFECKKRLLMKFPEAQIPLLLSPPFLPTSDIPISEIAEDLKKHKIDICWLAFGTPKQDFVANELLKEASFNVVCIGAAVNYISGKTKSPPMIVKNLGMEWLYRLLQEPQRLYKRYLLDLPRFIVLLIKKKFSK